LFFVPQLAATIIPETVPIEFFFVSFMVLAKVRARAPSKHHKRNKEEPNRSLHDRLGSSLFPFMDPISDPSFQNIPPGCHFGTPISGHPFLVSKFDPVWTEF